MVNEVRGKKLVNDREIPTVEWPLRSGGERWLSSHLDAWLLLLNLPTPAEKPMLQLETGAKRLQPIVPEVESNPLRYLSGCDVIRHAG